MKFLAVDDEPIVLGVLVGAIHEAVAGCEVRAFESPEDALDYMRQTDFLPDAAFLDIELYGMLGLDLARQIKQLSPATAIIFVTGFPQYALEAYSIHARGYLLKPPTVAKIREELEALPALTGPAIFTPAQLDSQQLNIQCFGNFEVFKNGTPVRFRRSKTKELFAYLVDRRGAALSTGELCAVLWEDRANEDSQRNQLRVLLSDLTRSLSEAGAEDALIKSRNRFSIAVEKVDCDLYRFLRQEPSTINAYHGEYMSQYSWAELTLGSLEQSG